MSVHCLALIDEPFARDQYARAKQAWRRRARLWLCARVAGADWDGPRDFDSGPVIPAPRGEPRARAASRSSALRPRRSRVPRRAARHARGSPASIDDPTGRRYAASNAVGDAVLLYSMTLGPAWPEGRAMIRLWRAPMFSPLGFVARAALIAVVYVMCEAVGLRLHFVLSGTAPTGNPTDYPALFSPAARIFILHFLFV